MTFEIELPIPPSLNNCYRNGRGRKGKRGARYKTNSYKDWETLAYGIFKKRKPLPAYNEKVHVTYAFYPKNGVFGDCSNYTKLVCDMLVKNGILKDDKHTILVSEHIYFAAYDPTNPRVHIKVEGI